MVPRAFLNAGDEVLLPCPDYSPYTRRPLLFGGKVVDVVPSGQDFQYDLEDFTSRITPRTKLAIISRPNAPVGNMVSRKLIEGLLAAGIVVVVDEAYAEFSSQTLSDMLLKYNNLIISRTFSKAMGLGGIRLGFLVAQPEVIKIIEKIRVPLNVSLLTQVAALAALEDADWIRKNTEKTIESRDRFFENVDRIPGIKAYPSEGNFILINCEGSGKKAAQFEKYLFEHDFLVRSFSNSRGLPGEYFFRITVGTEEDMLSVNALIAEFAKS
jgi:histidinol-phosphate aminotransferase